MEYTIIISSIFMVYADNKNGIYQVYTFYINDIL